ncbi:MAG: NUMOD3 domain-containing DNA-binding protein [Candidatus Pacearchaeota archaeon]
MEREITRRRNQKQKAYVEELERLTRQKYNVGLMEYIKQGLQQFKSLALIAKELGTDYRRLRYYARTQGIKIKSKKLRTPIRKDLHDIEDIKNLNLKNVSCLLYRNRVNWGEIAERINREYSMSLEMYLLFQHQFNNQSLSDLSSKLNVSYDALRNVMTKLGIPLKNYRGRKKSLVSDYLYLMGKYWGNGLSLTEIAKELGVSKQAVSYRMRVFEIPIRNKSEAISLAKSDKSYSIPYSIRGKTYEELYGEKKAREIKEKISAHFKGKTYEELYGLERAKEIRTKISQKNSGKVPWNKGLTKKDPRILKLLLSRGNTSGMKGKHHSKETRTKMSESHKRWWANKKALNNI